MNEPYRLPVHIINIPIRFQKVSIDYPQIAGLSNMVIQHRMNQAIVTQMNQIINDQGYFQQPINTEMLGFYEVKNNQRGILSLTQSNYTYFYHAANGLTIIKSLTFDIRTGKSYSLSELFKPGSNYIERISENIKAQIKSRNITLTTDFVSIQPDQDYYIADKALVVYFQMYEYTPRPYGLPAFPISVYELEDIVDENGPLGKMLAN